jgi:iron complex outermembrane receptor protein
MYDYRRNTVDHDVQRRCPAGDRHEFIWGLGYRVVADHLPPQGFADITDKERQTSSLFSAFVQDEIALVPDRLAFTIGSKLEHNDYTGLEHQPSARLTWTPKPQQTLWAAVSRAVRTPSRGEATARGTLPGDLSLGFLPRGIGTDDFESEELLAFELGYRVQPAAWLSLDIAAFHNDYDSLLTWESGTPFLEATPPPPHPILPMFTDNNARAESNGIELAVDCKVQGWWRLRAGYSYLEISTHLANDSTDPWAVGDAEGMPQNTAFVHSMMNLTRDLEFDLAGRYVDSTRIPWAEVSSYVELDVHLAWRPAPNLELFLVGQSLLHDQHAEAVPTMQATQVSEVERSDLALLRKGRTETAVATGPLPPAGRWRQTHETGPIPAGRRAPCSRLRLSRRRRGRQRGVGPDRAEHRRADEPRDLRRLEKARDAVRGAGCRRRRASE